MLFRVSFTCCFACRSRAVCALFVRDVLVVECRFVRVRARRARCFVCRQRAMSRVSARRLHVVVLGSLSSRCLRVPRVVRARLRAAVLCHALHILSRSANSSRLESLMLFKLLI
jgi:hypothetical protein